MANQNIDDKKDSNNAANGKDTASTPNKAYGGFRKSAKAKPNPLSKFTSYTYQLSLYMVTPDAYNAFMLSGRKNINALRTNSNGASAPGAIIIAQSGGSANTNKPSVSSDIKQALGGPYDYYIDNLKFRSVINYKNTGTDSFSYLVNFNIYEPYGFSFISHLKRASEQIRSLSKLPNIENIMNDFQQFFILGIRFQGYDLNGNPLEASSIYNESTRNVDTNASGVYEVFYDIQVKRFNYRLSKEPTVYRIEAELVTQQGLKTKIATIPRQIEISASNVGEALGGSGTGITGLMDILNKQEQDEINLMRDEQARKGRIANQYAVEFWGQNKELDPNGEIASAKLKSPADLDKLKTAMANINNLTQVSEVLAVKSSVDNNKQKMSFAQGSSVPHAISKIISQSQYLEKALISVLTSALESDPKTNRPVQENKDKVPFVKWFNCTPRVEVLGFDTIRQDWAYKITYIIQPYNTPATYSAYTKSNFYYAPAKQYKYFFTGQNTEVLNFEFSLNNNYYLVALGGDPSGQGTGGTGATPLRTNRKQDADSQNRLNNGFQAQGSYLTNLFDPQGLAKCKLSILGDPDFIIPSIPDSLNSVYQQLYNKGEFTIDANGGQVFIEVDFKESIDYNNETGKLDVNESILVFPYPQEIANEVEGVSFMVTLVDSSFSGGAFTQELSLIINDFPNYPNLGTERSDTSPTATPTATSAATPTATPTAPTNAGKNPNQQPKSRPNSQDDNQPDNQPTMFGGPGGPWLF